MNKGEGGVTGRDEDAAGGGWMQQSRRVMRSIGGASRRCVLTALLWFVHPRKAPEKIAEGTRYLMRTIRLLGVSKEGACFCYAYGAGESEDVSG